MKFDWCGDLHDHSIHEWFSGHGAKAHKDFHKALRNTGREIFLETVAGYWFLGKDIGKYSNSWRFCEDHHDKWGSTIEAVTCLLD